MTTILCIIAGSLALLGTLTVFSLTRMASICSRLEEGDSNEIS